MKHNLPGQLEIPAISSLPGDQLAVKSAARLVGVLPQKPCDHGLFSDEALQIDLIEMLMD